MTIQRLTALVGVLGALLAPFQLVWSDPPTLSIAELGRALFFDVRLSGPNTISCASCHQPEKQWSDGRPTAVGLNGQVLSRRTPSLWNVSKAQDLGFSFFWDGRAKDLLEQALMPIKNPDEMNQNLDLLRVELESIPAYQLAFKRFFPGQGVQEQTIAQALVAFEKTLVTPPTPYERWVQENTFDPGLDDQDVIDSEPRQPYKKKDEILSIQAQEGLASFVGRSCSRCHSLGNGYFSDGTFRDLGLESSDKGRQARSGEPLRFSQGFRVPSLINVALRPPYMHDGSMTTLDEVLDHYAENGVRGTQVPFRWSLGEKEALIQFLTEGLTAL